MPKILVVDGHKHVIRLMRATLERAGFQVVDAADARSALRQARALLPDLIFCTITLRDKDALAVLRKLKSDPATHHIPFVIMDYLRSNEASNPGLWQEFGADGAIFKPFTPHEATELAHSLLGSAD